MDSLCWGHFGCRLGEPQALDVFSATCTNVHNTPPLMYNTAPATTPFMRKATLMAGQDTWRLQFKIIQQKFPAGQKFKHDASHHITSSKHGTWTKANASRTKHEGWNEVITARVICKQP